MAGEFFREATSEEKKDFKPILVDNAPTITDLFKQKLAEKEKEYLNIKKPFCARCARLDFKKLVEDRIRDVEESAGYAEVSKIKLDIPDLDVYGKEDRFEFLKESKAMEPVAKALTDKVTRQIQIGVHRDYRCKVRKCGVSIFFSNEEIEDKTI